jgi:trimeric autotransporter adhesin
MTLMSSISKLTTSVDQLAGEANVTKAQLDAQVALAEAAIVATQAEQTGTEAARDEAAAHAATAATHLATVKAGVTYQGISAILAEKAVTAVDVFVYDTSLDSDGGAWRKRCQHTSWFNEALNTATRGARREWPAVAVIVAESNRFTIYDGDDPALPMWMVFTLVTNGLIRVTSTARSIVAMNGIFASATADNAEGLTVCDFIADNAKRYRTPSTAGAGASVALYGAGLASRNASGSGGSVLLGDAQQLVNAAVNDVAMTVLPDAPIDPATGLPVPTIAVATDGGVSVIKDNGTVVDSRATLKIGRCDFTSDGGLWYFRDEPSYLAIYSTAQDYQAGDGFGDTFAQTTLGAEEFDLLTGAESAVVIGQEFALGHPVATGIGKAGMMLHQPNYTDQTKGMSALLTSSYNTGWLPGSIKGAFLSSTDTASLVGSGNLATNGTFDSDTAWTKGTGWTISGGAASYDGVNFGSIFQNTGNIATGKTYKVSVTVGTNASGNGQFFLILRGTLVAQYNPSTGTTYTYFVKAGSGGNGDVEIYTNSTFPFTIDNISVELADADRSVNAKGLIVNGTITRSPVATGAELVAYSGFSAANYLEQPYNADLDFGTGDFCVMGWFKHNSGTKGIFCRAPIGWSSGPRLQVQLDGTGAFRVYGSAAHIVTPSANLADDIWHQWAVVRRAGVKQAYIDGLLVASITDLENLTIPAAVVRIGQQQVAVGAYANGPISALIRISATAPTADQIAKSYADERKLFMPGAQCTLYGTSDAVTALAHDPKTNLLHVGTSQGRSVFDGLVRVANTTTPVGTAISAVNGLVAEE